MKSQWKLAQEKLRGEILQCKWKFFGNWDWFGSPVLLTTYIKWLLLVPCTKKMV